MIKVDNLRKNYGNFTAVDGLSFEIFQNEIFGLLGPNGAGKTTTISMICGLLPSDEGSISIQSRNGRDRKSVIGYCPQENIFYPKLTCMEQLRFVGSIYGIPGRTVTSRAWELLLQMGLKDKAHVLAGNLSGGMKRRLNICLALIHDPEILILDEPEAGLDPQSRILVRDFIRAFGKEKTILLTTHNMDEADRLADRIAIMDHGKLLLLDTPANLKKTVGEGDILEIAIEKDDLALDTFTRQLTALGLNFSVCDNAMMIKHQSVIDKLPAIKSIADAIKFPLNEIKLRENTLEDVFIYLTGRNLRQ